MALTIRNITPEQIEIAKNLTGKGTASGSVVACVDMANRLFTKNLAQKQKIRELEEKLAHANRVFERLASSADEALCIVRQKELLQ